MRYLILTLLAVSICTVGGDSTAQGPTMHLAMATVAATEEPTEELRQPIVKTNLITAPESVPSGRTFLAKINGDLPWSVTPPETMVVELLDRGGNVVLFCTAGQSNITISVSHAIVHPTDAEIDAAPTDDKAKFKRYIAEHSRDEIYQDSAVVKVGKQPEPEPEPPDPDPDPPSDPLSRKVYDAALANKLPASECKTVASNMRAVIAQAVATSMTMEEMQSEIRERNEPVTGGKANWDAWEKKLPSIFVGVTSKKEAIDAYEKIANGLEAVR